MFTTLENFYRNYSIKNDMQPNETVLNRPSLRLKREVRELKSLLDIILKGDLEEYSSDKIYELDEYVQQNGLIYRSLADSNYANDLTDTNWFERIAIPSLYDFLNAFKSQEFECDGETVTFETNFQIDLSPAVFVDGVLQPTKNYTFDTFSVTLNEPPNEGCIVTVTAGYTYETGFFLPENEFIAEEGQYYFETNFWPIRNPTVFVDGTLQPSDAYTYGSNWVDLNAPVPEGTVVTIIDGSTSGAEFYNKDEIDEMLTNYYTKDESYSAEETDDLLKQLKDDIYNDDYIVKSDTVYTKEETDEILGNYPTLEDLSKLLDEKADKSDNLAGYGITDAYTKDEVLGILEDYLTVDDFNRDNIIYILFHEGDNTGVDADTLDGCQGSQFMRADIETSNTGGVNFWSEDQNNEFFLTPDDETFKYPTLRFNRNVDQNNERNYRTYHEANSEGLFLVFEGDFAGVWYQNLCDFGIVNPGDYYFTIIVTNLGTGQQFDFLPKDYGTGFDFNSFSYNISSDNDGSYQYGLIKDNIVKCYSYVKTTNSTMVAVPGHYTLIGFHKAATIKRRHNQGDDPEEFFQTRLIDDEDFIEYQEEYKNYETPTEPDDISDDNAFSWLTDGATGSTVSTDEVPVYEPAMQPFPASITDDGTSTVYITYLPKNADVTITITAGDGTILEKSLQTDKYGEAYVIVQGVDPYMDDICVTVSGDNIKETTCIIYMNMSASTLLYTAQFGTLGTNNTPDIGLGGETTTEEVEDTTEESD